MNWRWRLLIPLAGCLLLVTAPAAAEIFKYRDSSGHLHFTDQPKKRGSGFKLLWRSSNDYRYSSLSRIDITSMARNRERFSPLIKRVAKNAGLEPALLHAVVRAESAYDPQALSRKGAQGLMQLIPATAERYGVDNSWDPAQNLAGGARYLRDLLAMFDQDLELALAAYNAGENAVIKYGNRIPPYPETQQYVRKVVLFYDQRRELASAYSAVQ